MNSEWLPKSSHCLTLSLKYHCALFRFKRGLPADALTFRQPCWWSSTSKQWKALKSLWCFSTVSAWRLLQCFRYYLYFHDKWCVYISRYVYQCVFALIWLFCTQKVRELRFVVTETEYALFCLCSERSGWLELSDLRRRFFVCFAILACYSLLVFSVVSR